MLGMMVTDKEAKELEYVLKRELDEMLFDLQDHRFDSIMKHSMEERYKLLFKLFIRIAPKEECWKYVRNPLKTFYKPENYPLT